MTNDNEMIALAMIAVGCIVALLGEPLAGAMLMLGFEVGRTRISETKKDRDNG